MKNLLTAYSQIGLIKTLVAWVAFSFLPIAAAEMRINCAITNSLMRVQAVGTTAGYFRLHLSNDLTNWTTPIFGIFKGTGEERIVDYNWPARAERFGPHEFYKVELWSPLIVIRNQPASVAQNAGSEVSLSLKADGPPGLTYQWWKDGFPINGATNSTLRILSCSKSDEGYYLAVVRHFVSPMASQSTIQVLVSVN